MLKSYLRTGFIRKTQKGMTTMNLKKINRGIALGCIIAAVTAGYVIYDHQQFSKNTPVITDAVEGYLDDMADARCSQKDQQKLADDYKEVISKHWTNDANSSLNTFYNKNDIMTDLNTAAVDCEPTGYFTDYDFNINNISIKKYGGGAVATVDYDVVCEFYGTPLEIGDYGVSNVENNNYDQNGNPINDSTIKYRQNKSYKDAEFYLKKVDGQWKIFGIEQQWDWDSFNVEIINDGNSDKKGGEVNG